MSYILQENLRIALECAIKYTQEQYKKQGLDFEPGIVGGWKQNLKDLKENGTIEVKS